MFIKTPTAPRIIKLDLNVKCFLFSMHAPIVKIKNGTRGKRYLGPHETRPCQVSNVPKWKMKEPKKTINKIHSGLFLLKKSGNERKINNKTGQKIKSPTPGLKSKPNPPMWSGYSRRLFRIGNPARWLYNCAATTLDEIGVNPILERFPTSVVVKAFSNLIDGKYRKYTYDKAKGIE